jgi:hypothetical protein
VASDGVKETLSKAKAKDATFEVKANTEDLILK